jgi:hypothetical protein
LRKAAGSVSKQRSLILDFFGDLPEAIRNAEIKRKLHPKDGRLIEIFNDFVVSLLLGLAAMIHWLTERRSSKFEIYFGTKYYPLTICVYRKIFESGLPAIREQQVN